MNLHALSKINESCMLDQMYEYFNKILSKYQCGFHHGCSSQHQMERDPR